VGEPIPSASEELLEALRSQGFWIAVGRNAIPVVGVFAFGWVPMHLVAYFLLESWLVLALRASLEIVLDPKYTEPSTVKGTGAFAREWLRQLGASAAVFGVLIAFYAWFIVAVTVPGTEWRAFLDGGYRHPNFLLGLGALLATIAFDAYRFASRFDTRDAAGAARDDAYVTGMFYRVVLVAASCLGVGTLSRLGLGAGALVLAIAVVLTFLEGMPRQAARLFSAPAKTGPT